MSDLGDLLESLHQAAHGHERVRIVWRTWHHNARANAALIGAVEGAGPDAESPPPERHGRIRVWLEHPGRWREEREGDERGYALAIRDGARWWTYDDVQGALTGEIEPGGGFDDDLALHLDPAALLDRFDFEPLGAGERAHRRVLKARATPRPPHPTADIAFVLGAGADELLLEVDADHGVLLRTDARRDGAPFEIFEAEEVEFDAGHPDGTFTFEPPPGEEPHTWEMYDRIHELPLHEAAQTAPFAVFVPTHVPEEWGLAVSYTAPHD